MPPAYQAQRNRAGAVRCAAARRPRSGGVGLIGEFNVPRFLVVSTTLHVDFHLSGEGGTGLPLACGSADAGEPGSRWFGLVREFHVPHFSSTATAHRCSTRSSEQLRTRIRISGKICYAVTTNFFRNKIEALA